VKNIKQVHVSAFCTLGWSLKLTVLLSFCLLLPLHVSAGEVSEQGKVSDGSAGHSESPVVSEAAPAETPHEIVALVTERMLKIVQNDDSAQRLKENPAEFYADIEDIMSVAIDFKFIARSVMGAKYWKQATREQKKAFIKTFRTNLIETYAKGMVGFSNLSFSIEPALEGTVFDDRANVIQLAKSAQVTNRISYTMKKRKSGEWKLINIVLNGINVGKSFRTQFSQSVKDNNGDLAAAISSWSV